MDRRIRPLVGIAAVAAVGTAALVASPDAALDRLARLADDPRLFLVALAAFALTRPLVAWPTTLVAVAAGYGFGAAAVPLGAALMTVSSAPSYAVARYCRGAETGRVGALGERFVAAAGPVRGVAAARLLPIHSDVGAAAAGVAGVPARPFLLGTFLGELPWAAAGVLFGAALGSLSADAASAAVDWRIALAVALAGAAVVAPSVYRSVAGRDRTDYGSGTPRRIGSEGTDTDGRARSPESGRS